MYIKTIAQFQYVVDLTIMLRSFRDYNYQQYSPFLFGIVFTPIIYTVIALFAQPEVHVPKWLWFYGVPIFVIGLLLQLLSARVLWIRLYQAFVTISLAVISLILLWVVLSKGQSWGHQFFASITIALGVIGSVIAIHQKNRTISVNMPQGATGVLDSKTGLVDPTKSPPYIQKSLDRNRDLAKAWQKFSPLVAGIVMFLVQVLPSSGISMFVAWIAFAWMILGVIGASHAIYSSISILRWEQQHDRPILVKR